MILMSARFPLPSPKMLIHSHDEINEIKPFEEEPFFCSHSDLFLQASTKILPQILINSFVASYVGMSYHPSPPPGKSDVIFVRPFKSAFPTFWAVLVATWFGPASTNNVSLLGHIVGCFIHCVPARAYEIFCRFVFSVSGFS